MKPTKKEFETDAEQLANVIELFVKRYGQATVPEEVLPEGVDFPKFAAAGTMNYLLSFITKGPNKSEEKNDLNYIG
jgi:hypothetical protein